MNGNNNNISSLANLSDSKLQGLVNDIAAAVGASPQKTKGLDMARLRATLSTISDDEAKRLIDRAGKEKAQAIYRAIQRSKD